MRPVAWASRHLFFNLFSFFLISSLLWFDETSGLGKQAFFFNLFSLFLPPPSLSSSLSVVRHQTHGVGKQALFCLFFPPFLSPLALSVLSLSLARWFDEGSGVAHACRFVASVCGLKLLVYEAIRY